MITEQQGRFGFPISDPKKIKHENGDTEWYQAFENDEEIHVKTDGTVETVGLGIIDARQMKARCLLFLMDSLMDSVILLKQ